MGVGSLAVVVVMLNGGEGGEGKVPKKKKKGVGAPGRVGEMPVVVVTPAHPGLAAVPGVISLCHLAAWKS